MTKILVVDDEERYRDLITHVLSSDGYEARAAASGRDALDTGARYRPDVLVTDWMLKDDIHGLHVVHVLRAVLPSLRAIMMTGFPNDDLREGARTAGVHAFLEKPFDAQRIQETVREVIGAGQAASPAIRLAMMEIDSAGSIAYANSAAGDMMAETPAGRKAGSLAALFSEDVRSSLQACMDRWVAVLPQCDGRKHWHLRSQEPLDDGSRLVVLRRWDEPHYIGLSLVEMLLGVRDIEHARWPFDHRVLIIDDEAILRTLSVSMLEGAGAGCYAVATPKEACRLLSKDEYLRFVILDFEMPGTDARATVEAIRAVRPEATIVGTGGAGHRGDFAAMGVEHYIEKPWRVDDLINLLTGRIGNCVSCGLPIPLRRPRPGEAGVSWACCNCGGRYFAILDEDCPEGLLSNVRRA